jgi:mannose-6-phosphate isomerase-like protein (cupin superfamily)
MAIRRVVTGHSEAGRAVVVSDNEVAPMLIGARGAGTTLLWGRNDAATYPDDGRAEVTPYPPPGGSFVAVMELAPDGDEFHEFVRNNLGSLADPDDPGMHCTPSTDYDVVLEGTIGLELDDGVEVTLGPGDVVVQNGTRHRWHNRGNTVARLLSVAVGAHHHIEGGRPV